jgi:hypothetical protein
MDEGGGEMQGVALHRGRGHGALGNQYGGNTENVAGKLKPLKASEHGECGVTHLLGKGWTAQLADDFVRDEQLELSGVAPPPTKARCAPAAGDVARADRAALAKETGFEVDLSHTLSLPRIEELLHCPESFKKERKIYVGRIAFA